MTLITTNANANTTMSILQNLTKIYSSWKNDFNSDKCPPRPPNSFILYRQHNYHSLKGLGISHLDISKEVAKMWQKETLDIRKKFKKLSNIIKVLHSKKYPNYKYRPRIKSRKKCKHKKAKKNIEKICIEVIEKNDRDKNIENSIGSENDDSTSIELNSLLPELIPNCSTDDSTDIVLTNNLPELLSISSTENNYDSTSIELNSLLPELIPNCSTDDSTDIVLTNNLPELLSISSTENNYDSTSIELNSLLPELIPNCSTDDSTDIVLTNNLPELLSISSTENNYDSTSIELNSFMPELLSISSMEKRDDINLEINPMSQVVKLHDD